MIIFLLTAAILGLLGISFLGNIFVSSRRR